MNMITDKAYYARMDEKRKEDFLKVLMEDAGLDPDEDIPYECRDRWEKIAEEAVPVFDRLLGFASDYWDIYWNLIRTAINEVKEKEGLT